MKLSSPRAVMSFLQIDWKLQALKAFAFFHVLFQALWAVIHVHPCEAFANVWPFETMIARL